MLQTGFDCFAPVTAEVLARAKTHGNSFVARYYGSPGSKKLLLPPEVKLITDAGLRIFSVFERTAGRPLEGTTAGTQDAEAAMTQAAAVGQPTGTTICFAVDQDIDIAKTVNRQLVAGYFTAVKIVMAGRYRVGGYGGGDVLDYLLTHDLISVAWLAGAMGWRGSRKFDATLRWHLKQGPTVKGSDLGIEYDPNVAVDLDKIGAWTLAPPLSADGVIDLFDLQQRLAAGGFYRGPIDGIPGKDTAAALLAYYQAQHR